MRQLDETDRTIVACLQYDGRMPFTKIATELGLSEGTVRRRVKRMMDAGMLQIVGIVEPQYLDWQSAAMVGAGGGFLSKRSTVKGIRGGEWYVSRLGMHDTFEGWEAAGRPKLLEEACEKVAQILATHQRGNL